MLINRKTWPQHRWWCYLVILLGALAVAAWGGEAFVTKQRPGGSSLSGFSLGIAAAALFLFEMLLWFRKRLRGYHRLGRALWWTKAHVWLGLLTLPLVLLHSGFYFRGTLSLTLLTVFLVVFFSGVVGLVLQQFLPRRMIDDVPAETVYAQINEVIAALRQEAARIVASVCEPTDVMAVSAASTAERSRRPFGLATEEAEHRAAKPPTDHVLDFYRRFVDSYLQPGSPRRAPLASRERAANMFAGLRSRASSDAQEAIDALETLCDQRRQLAVQARLHFWLYAWLTLHLPLSVVMLVLLVLHVWFAVMYW